MSENSIVPVAENNFDVALAILQRVDGFDEKISTYLSFRACYFSINEALRLSGSTKKDLTKWYEDFPEFKQIDTVAIKDFQRLHYRHALTVQFTRNFRMVVQKDAEIISKSLDQEEELTKFEEQYLTKMRGTYSPDQLHRLASAIHEDGKAPMNFLQVVMMANSERSIKVGKEQPDIIEIAPSPPGGGGDSIPGEVCIGQGS